MLIQVNPGARILRPARLEGFDPPARLIAQFRSFLRLYESNRFIFLRGTPEVIRVLQKMGPQFKAVLGGKYLGLALGGSLVRGLAAPTESDVDYILFVGGVDPGDRELFERIKSIEGMLKERGLRPCDLLHTHDLIRDVTFGPEMVASVFANYIIDLAVESETLLRLVGQTISRWRERYDRRNFDLDRQVRESYRQLSGCDVTQVVAKFVEKRVFGADFGNCGMNIVPEHLRERMVNIARPYLARREQNFPFPEEMLSEVKIQ